jgi:DNA-binding XRE family transcriptional regulator
MLLAEAVFLLRCVLCLSMMKPFSSTHLKLGQKIKKIRTEAGITQEELAAKTGVDRSYMGFIERGEKNPTLETIRKIAWALRVSVKELFS